MPNIPRGGNGNVTCPYTHTVTPAATPSLRWYVNNTANTVNYGREGTTNDWNVTYTDPVGTGSPVVATVYPPAGAAMQDYNLRLVHTTDLGGGQYTYDYFQASFTVVEAECDGDPDTPPDPDVTVEGLTATISAITLPQCATSVELVLDKETSPGSGVWVNQIESAGVGPHEYEGLAGSYRCKWRAENADHTTGDGIAESAWVPFTLGCEGVDPDEPTDAPTIHVTDCDTIDVDEFEGDLPQCATSVEVWHKPPDEEDFNLADLPIAGAAVGTHQFRFRAVNETGAVFQGDSFGPIASVIISDPESRQVTIELVPADDPETPPSSNIEAVEEIELNVALQTLGMAAVDAEDIEWTIEPPITPAPSGGDWTHNFTETTTITATVVDAHGCETTGQATVTIIPEECADFECEIEVGPEEGAVPLAVSVAIEVTGGTEPYGKTVTATGPSFPGGGSTYSGNFTAILDRPGVHTFHFEATDANGCTCTKEKVVTVRSAAPRRPAGWPSYPPGYPGAGWSDESSAGGFPTSADVTSTMLGTSEPLSGTSTGGVATSSGVSSTGGGTSSGSSGTSTGGVPTSENVESTGLGTSSGSSGTEPSSAPTSLDVSSSNLGTSQGSSGTSTGGFPTSDDVSSTGFGTSEPLSGTSTGGVPTSSGVSSSMQGTSEPLSGTSTGGVATSEDVQSTGLGTSAPLSGTEPSGFPTSADVSSTGLGSSQGSSGTSTGGVATSDNVSSSAMGTSEGSSGSDVVDCCPDYYYWNPELNQCMPVVLVPDKPNAPGVAKVCEPLSIVVTPPAWPTDRLRPVTSMVLRRSKDDGATWEEIHTWSVTGGTYTDTDVTKYESVRYSIRSGNSAGESSWSNASAAITLQSTRLTITILEPDANDTLTGKETIRFTLADSGAISGTCPDPDIVVRLGGLSVDLDTLEIETPNPCVADDIEARNTTYSIEVDTRLYPQGLSSIEVEAIGTDCCPKRATRAVTLANDFGHGILFRDVEYLFPAPAGNLWTTVSAAFENRALSVNPEQRWWLLCRLWTDTAGAELTGDSLAEWEEEWLEMQVMALKKGQGYAASGARIERQQWYGSAALDFPGQAITLRTRWEPAEVVNWYQTGLERVTKIRKYATDKFIVLARDMDGGAAKVFDFDGTLFTELIDLSDYDAESTFDIARVGDKVFCAYSGGLFYVDVDAGDASANLTPRGETRPIAFIEAVGSNLIALFVNAALGSERTRCYRWDGSWRLMWALDDAVTLAAEGDGKLGMAAGAKLYSSDGGTSAPTLTHTFNSNITALHPAMVGLSNGHIWTHSPVGGWKDAANRPTAITAVAAFRGSLTAERAVAATATNELFEQQQDTTAWILGRELESPEELEEATIDRVAALLQWEKLGDPDDDSDDTDSLLIGTGNSGLFGVLQKSQLNEASGAVLTSGITLPALDPTYTPEPEEE